MEIKERDARFRADAFAIYEGNFVPNEAGTAIKSIQPDSKGAGTGAAASEKDVAGPAYRWAGLPNVLQDVDEVEVPTEVEPPRPRRCRGALARMDIPRAVRDVYGVKIVEVWILCHIIGQDRTLAWGGDCRGVTFGGAQR